MHTAEGSKGACKTIQNFPRVLPLPFVCAVMFDHDAIIARTKKEESVRKSHRI